MSSIVIEVTHVVVSPYPPYPSLSDSFHPLLLPDYRFPTTETVSVSVETPETYPMGVLTGL